MRLKLKICWEKNYLLDSSWILKIINRFMKGGKKELIENEFLHCVSDLKKITTTPLLLFLGILIKVKPILGVKKIRKRTRSQKERRKNKKIEVPIPLRKIRCVKIGLKWFRLHILNHWKGLSFRRSLFQEILALYVYKNSTIFNFKKRIYKTSVQNRILVHFRWR